MSIIGRRGIHFLHKLNAENVPVALIEKGQSRVIDASLTLIRERAKLKGELVRALGGAVASTSLLGVPLGHNSSFLQGPAFAPPRIREAIWCGSTNSTTEEGKELNDPRVLTDVGDVPVQEIRDCGVDDDRLMNVISESVKLVMEQDPLRPLVLGGDHSISYPVVRAVAEKLGGPVDILHLDAHPDIYHAFEDNKYSHASSFARIMEGGYARRLLQVGIRSINNEGRVQGKRFGVEQYEMRTFSRDRHFLENLVSISFSLFFSPSMSHGSVAPCVLYGSNAERLGSASGTFANHCLPYSALYLIGNTFFGWNCLAPWFSYPRRTAIRRKFNLEGSCEALNRSCGCCGSFMDDEQQQEQCETACDFATHVFCHPCALCQEGREIRRRLPHPGFNAQPVLVMIPPGEQAMGRGA